MNDIKIKYDAKRLDHMRPHAVEKMKDILSSIKYKDGFSFFVDEGESQRYNASHVVWRTTMDTPDSTKPEPRPNVTIGVSTSLVIDAVLDKSDNFLYDQVFRGIKALENHEAAEWFRVNGVLIYDPHAEKIISEA